MIKYNELSISDDRASLVIDLEIDSASVTDGYILSTIYLEYYKNRTSTGEPSAKALKIFDEDEQSDPQTTYSGIIPDEALSVAGMGTTEFRDGLFYVIVKCAKNTYEDSTAMNPVVAEHYRAKVTQVSLTTGESGDVGVAVKNSSVSNLEDFTVEISDPCTAAEATEALADHDQPFCTGGTSGDEIKLTWKLKNGYLFIDVKGAEGTALCPISDYETVGAVEVKAHYRSEVVEVAPVLDEMAMYEIGMGEVAQMNASNKPFTCRENVSEFENFVILWHALDLSLKARDADQLDKIWSRFVALDNYPVSPCNCR